MPKPGAALAAAGIDTTVLPDERVVDELLDEPQSEPDGIEQHGLDTPAANDVLLSDPATPGADDQLVSWDEQQDDIREERMAGVSAEGSAISDQWPSPRVETLSDPGRDSAPTPWQGEAIAPRPTCRMCGEPIVLDDPDDDMSWIHAQDANDRGDHTAEV